jgi:hypothetical protein
MIMPLNPKNVPVDEEISPHKRLPPIVSVALNTHGCTLRYTPLSVAVARA